MKVHLKFLRRGEVSQEALQKDGWHLERQADGSVTAGHPLVCDEAAARNRLYVLGLLTSAAASIEFIRRERPQSRS
jgi:hypothetical protein